MAKSVKKRRQSCRGALTYYDDSDIVRVHKILKEPGIIPHNCLNQ